MFYSNERVEREIMAEIAVENVELKRCPLAIDVDGERVDMDVLTTILDFLLLLLLAFFFW